MNFEVDLAYIIGQISFRLCFWFFYIAFCVSTQQLTFCVRCLMWDKATKEASVMRVSLSFIFWILGSKLKDWYLLRICFLFYAFFFFYYVFVCLHCLEKKMGVVIRIGIIIWTIIMLGLNTTWWHLLQPTLTTTKCLMVSDFILFYFFGIGSGLVGQI